MTDADFGLSASRPDTGSLILAGSDRPWPAEPAQADLRAEEARIRWTRPDPDLLREILAELRELR